MALAIAVLIWDFQTSICNILIIKKIENSLISELSVSAENRINQQNRDFTL